jgi:hypothetical protein
MQKYVYRSLLACSARTNENFQTNVRACPSAMTKIEEEKKPHHLQRKQFCLTSRCSNMSVALA